MIRVRGVAGLQGELRRNRNTWPYSFYTAFVTPRHNQESGADVKFDMTVRCREIPIEDTVIYYRDAIPSKGESGEPGLTQDSIILSKVLMIRAAYFDLRADMAISISQNWTGSVCDSCQFRWGCLTDPRGIMHDRTKRIITVRCPRCPPSTLCVVSINSILNPS